MLQEQFDQHITTHLEILKNTKLLLAISGGIDSMVMLELCKQLNLDIAIAHVNFKLRGDASDQDAAFVQEVAHRNDYSFHLKEVDTAQYVAATGSSTQMAARDLRYQFFENLCREYSYDYVLTAHHLDDQLETFLINLNRGAGLQGLTGIPELNDQIARPLLPFSRDQIHKYAVQNKISWREDASNKKNTYQRNQLRNQVLPLLHQALPQLRQHLGNTFNYLKDASKMVDDAVLRFRESEITTTKTGINIPIKSLKNTSAPLSYLHYLLQPYRFPSTEEVYELVHSQSGKYVKNDDYIIHVKGDHLCVEAIQPKQNIQQDVPLNDSIIELKTGVLKVELLNDVLLPNQIKEASNRYTLFLDIDQIGDSLQLRNWKKGDRIHPYGMHGSKLVSDVLTDQKVSFIDKEKTLVLKSGSVVLWILGHRSSNHFTVTPQTNQILKLTYQI